MKKNNFLSGDFKFDAALYLKYCFLLAVIIFIVFSPVLKNNFVSFDDYAILVNNDTVHGLSVRNLKNILTSDFLKVRMPVVFLSYALEYEIFDLNPAGYISVSLITHIINACLVFLLIFMFSKNYFTAFLTALLFSIHPLRVESAAWISERKGLFYALFFLLSFIFYLRHTVKPRNFIFYFSALIFFILSLFSKPQGITLPIIFLLTEIIKAGRLKLRSFLKTLPFFAVSGFYLILSFLDAGITAPRMFFPLKRILTACFGLVFYVYKTVWPFNLSVSYPYNMFSLSGKLPAEFIAAPFILLFMIGVIIFAAAKTKYKTPIYFFSFFYFFSLLPVLQIVSSGLMLTADRYSYIPSIALFYGFSLFFHNLYFKIKKRALKFFFIFLMTLIVIFFSYLSYRRCAVWKNGFTLWTDVIEKYPLNPVAYNGLGTYSAQNGNYGDALKYFKKAVELRPDYSEAAFNLANVLARRKMFDEAAEQYKLSIKYNPDYIKSYNNLGRLLARQNKTDEAVFYYKEGLKINESDYIILHNLAGAYEKKGDIENALEFYKKSLNANPGFFGNYYKLSHMLYEQENYEEAYLYIEKGLKISPYEADMIILKIKCFLKLKRRDEAYALYEKLKNENAPLALTEKIKEIFNEYSKN